SGNQRIKVHTSVYNFVWEEVREILEIRPGVKFSGL
ncbi:MAG: hypothetical protein RIT31_446, partial [Actinomycetota bacterium]